MTEEANYEKPASQVDLEERQEAGFASSAVLSTSDEAARRQAEQGEDKDARSFAVEGNDLSSYSSGISPEYMTYANESEAPLKAEEGPEAVLEEFVDDEEERQEEYGNVPNIPAVGPNDEPPPEETPEEEPPPEEPSASPTAVKASSSSS